MSHLNIFAAVVQSTDKNFLVPVGGAVVMCPAPEFLHVLASCYPGRASISPVLDLTMTLLSMGVSGFTALHRERARLWPVFNAGLLDVVSKFGLKVLPSQQNCISVSVSLDELVKAPESLSFLGSMLFVRNVSGSRVIVNTGKVTTISGYDFVNWGSHTNDYSHSYLTVACSVGLTEMEVINFLERLNKVLRRFTKE